ncbi:MAG: hypothetical protein OXT67_13085 [Zetaproteobacteria bacterium]|nr:hypothetical protein [Zetaproteobacteria bacterium]
MAATNFIIHLFALILMLMFAILLIQAYRHLSILRQLLQPERRFKLNYPCRYWQGVAAALQVPFHLQGKQTSRGKPQKIDTHATASLLSHFILVEFTWKYGTTAEEEAMILTVQPRKSDISPAQIQQEIKHACGVTTTIIID